LRLLDLVTLELYEVFKLDHDRDERLALSLTEASTVQELDTESSEHLEVRQFHSCGQEVIEADS